MGKRGLAILALVGLLGGATAAEPPMIDGSGEVRPLPRPAILLFWAAWCAPCRAEVANIAELTAAAAPMPVIVVSTDASRSSRRLLAHLTPAQVRFPATASDQPMAMLPGEAVGLPAAMAIGRGGAICAQALGAVDAAVLRGWRAACLGSEGNR